MTCFLVGVVPSALGFWLGYYSLWAIGSPRRSPRGNIVASALVTGPALVGLGVRLMHQALQAARGGVTEWGSSSAFPVGS